MIISAQSESYVISGKGMNTIKIKEELKDDEEEISIIPFNRPIKEEPSTSDQSSSLVLPVLPCVVNCILWMFISSFRADYQKILENKNKFEKDKEEHNRKVTGTFLSHKFIPLQIYVLKYICLFISCASIVILFSSINEWFQLSILSARRAESRRRFDEEMRQIDEEERIEKEKMSVVRKNCWFIWLSIEE